MAKSDPTKDPEFKRVLGNLLSAPPKPHSEMKLGPAATDEAKLNTIILAAAACLSLSFMAVIFALMRVLIIFHLVWRVWLLLNQRVQRHPRHRPRAAGRRKVTTSGETTPGLG
jgi:hypothetical protein